jgi:hypothetical protein
LSDEGKMYGRWNLCPFDLQSLVVSSPCI